MQETYKWPKVPLKRDLWPLMIFYKWPNLPLKNDLWPLMIRLSRRKKQFFQQNSGDIDFQRFGRGFPTRNGVDL
jgi:hypothetical protein